MIVYFLTLLSVIILVGLAQNKDYPYPSPKNNLQVNHSKTTSTLFFFTAVILIMVAGLRYYVGTDYGAYYRGYWRFANRFRTAVTRLEEPGYPFLCIIAKFFGGGSATAIFLASVVTIWPALRVIYRHTDRLLMATLLYVLFGCWEGSFNGIRQYLAATMLFCGYEALEAKKLKKFMVYVFFAFLFHRSAIVMAALFFAVHQKISVRNLLIVLVASIIAMMLYERLLIIAGWVTENDYSSDQRYTSRAVNYLRVLAAIAPAIVFLILYYPIEKGTKVIFCINLLVVHAAICVATMNSALLFRIGIYTNLFRTIAIPELLKGLRPNTRRSLTIVMIPLYAFFWWYELSHGKPVFFHWIWER